MSSRYVCDTCGRPDHEAVGVQGWRCQGQIDGREGPYRCDGGLVEQLSLPARGCADPDDPRPEACRQCGTPIEQPRRGRARFYCSADCRVRWHRESKRAARESAARDARERERVLFNTYHRAAEALRRLHAAGQLDALESALVSITALDNPE